MKKHVPSVALCPVKDSLHEQPHTADPLIKALALRYTAPDKLLRWVQTSLGEIHDSIRDDYKNNRHFGWLTRLRQVEIAVL